MSGLRGDWMQAFSGRQVHPADPRPEEFCVEDIARALSMQCRFAGHVRAFYSVAQHSVLASRMAPRPFKMDALMHDRTEAYISDIVKPAKRSLPDYMAMELRMEEVSAAAFGLAHPMPAEVKLVDERMLVTEAMQLVSGANPWWLAPGMPAPYPILIKPWGPRRAMREFLATYRRLEAA